MQVVRGILFIPILVFVSPALVLLAVTILLMDTKEGPLRSLFLDEVRAYGFGQGFERFMQNVFVPTYRHNVQSFVLVAAGFLVVTVGLRGLGVLPLQFVYVALAVEFTLLVMWAITVYFTPEDPITENPGVLVHQTGHPALVEDKTEKMIATMKDLAAHLALLENRLKITETRFEQLGKLDDSLQGLSTKLNGIVSDQFNLRVKREFEQLLSELARRTSESDPGGPK